MQRPFRTLTLTLALAMAVPSLIANPAAAQTVDEQRKEVARIVDQLDALAEQADILAEDYNEALEKKSQLDVDIAKTRERVNAKEAEVSGLRSQLAELAVQTFTGAGGDDALGPLFTDAGAYNESLRGTEYRSIVYDVGSTTTDNLDEVISDLNDEKSQLDSKIAEQTSLIEQIETKKTQTEKLTTEYKQRRQTEEARLGTLIKEEEQRRAAEAWAAAQAQAAAQRKAAQAAAQKSASSANKSSSVKAAAKAAPAAASPNSNSNTNSNSNSNSSSNASQNSNSSQAAAPAPAPAAAPEPKPSSNAPGVSGQAGNAISAARSQLGVPYKYATSSPGVSFDCSGLTSYAWAQAGVSLPRNSRAQAASLPSVNKGDAQPGDLVFFYSPISHVGIYLGGGMMVHAPNTGSVVKISGVSWNKVTYVGRPG